MTAKERIKAYEEEQRAEKARLKAITDPWRRFWSICLFVLVWPFKWLFVNLRDWRTAIIFVLVCAVVSVEVWLPYIMAALTWGTSFSRWMLGIGSACWIFWLGPGTPFIPLCIALTVGIKSLMDRISGKH